MSKQGIGLEVPTVPQSLMSSLEKLHGVEQVSNITISKAIT